MLMYWHTAKWFLRLTDSKNWAASLIASSSSATTGAFIALELIYSAFARSAMSYIFTSYKALLLF
jgi:hypothetical protein